MFEMMMKVEEEKDEEAKEESDTGVEYLDKEKEIQEKENNDHADLGKFYGTVSWFYHDLTGRWYQRGDSRG